MISSGKILGIGKYKDTEKVLPETLKEVENMERLVKEILTISKIEMDTYTTNFLFHGAAPKDEQELLGHSDVSTTMNIYAHATREARRTSARLLDKVVGTA